MNFTYIDIETLDTADTAVVLQIGVLLPGRPEPLVYNLDVFDQVLAGRTVSPETVAWWNKKERPMKRKDCVATAGILSFLRDLLDSEVDSVVTRGHFDVPILKNLFESFGVVWPIPYWNVLDARSIERIAWLAVPSFDKTLKEIDARWPDRHDAGVDCSWQRERIEAALAALQGGQT